MQPLARKISTVTVVLTPEKIGCKATGGFASFALFSRSPLPEMSTINLNLGVFDFGRYVYLILLKFSNLIGI